MLRQFKFQLYNDKTGKEITRKSKGETRLQALIFLIGKIRHPENYTVLDATSVTA